jgi:hypothetical protein
VRVFLDTNVLVSAFATRGLCAEVLELLLLDHDLIVGRKVLGELEKRCRNQASRRTFDEIVDFIAGEAAQVRRREPAGGASRADAIVMVKRSPETPSCLSPATPPCCVWLQSVRSGSFRLASSGRSCAPAPCSASPY